MTPQQPRQPIRGSIGLNALTLAGTNQPARPLLGTRENPVPMYSGMRVSQDGVYTQKNRGRPSIAQAFSPLQTRQQRQSAGSQLPPSPSTPPSASDIASSLFRTTPPGAGGRGRGRGR